MQGFADNFIPVIPLEDEPVHTQMHPFCDDATCHCHKDPELLATIGDAVTNGLLTSDEATRFVKGEMV